MNQETVRRPKTIVYVHRVVSFFGFHLMRVVIQDKYDQIALWRVLRGEWYLISAKLARMIQMGPEHRAEGQFAQVTADELLPYEESASRLESYNRISATAIR